MYRFPEDGEKKSYKLKSIFWAVRFATALFKAKTNTRPTIKIFYATETGTTKQYAKRLETSFSGLFNVKMIGFNEFDKITTEAKGLSGFCLFLTSTFGNGDPPRMAEALANWLDDKLAKSDAEKKVRIELPPTILEEDPVGGDGKLKRKDSVKLRRKKSMKRVPSTLYQRMSAATSGKALQSLK